MKRALAIAPALLLVAAVLGPAGFACGQPSIPQDKIPSGLPHNLQVLVARLYDLSPEKRIESIRQLAGMGEAAAAAVPLVAAMQGDAGNYWEYRSEPHAPQMRIPSRSFTVRKEVFKALPQMGKAGAAALRAMIAEGDADTQVRAALALVEAGDPGAFEPLLKRVPDAEPDVRATAVRALGQAGDRRAVPVLIPLLKDEKKAGVDRSTWFFAAEALGALKDPRAVGPLVEMMKEADPGKQAYAARALGEIGDRAAVGPLLDLLKSDLAGPRAEAARALGLIGDPRAAEAVVAALSDKERGVRWEAGWAAGRLRDKRAVEPLLKMLDPPDMELRRAAVWSLREIGDERAVEPLVKWLKNKTFEARQEAAEAIGAAGPAGVKRLIALLQDPELDLRALAAIGLGKARAVQAIEPLVALMRAEPESYPADSAAEALAAIGKPGAAVLAEFVKGDDVPMRFRAVQALGKAGGAEAVEVLMSVLGEKDLGIWAAQALARIGPPAVVSLTQAAGRKEDGPVRRNAGLALSTLRGYKPMKGLLEMLANGKPAERAAAAQVLGMMEDPPAVRPLAAALKDPEPQVRAAAARALAERREVAALDELMEALDDKNEGVRLEVIAALGVIADPRAVEPLLKRLQDPETPIRVAALSALAGKDDERVPAALVGALDDKAPKVREKAGEVLETRTPRGKGWNAVEWRKWLQEARPPRE
jgi:HEAT repeat protein